METLLYNSTSLLRVTLSQHGKAFGLPATPVALLVPCLNTLSLIYTKKLVKCIIPNSYHLLIYSSSYLVRF